MKHELLIGELMDQLKFNTQVFFLTTEIQISDLKKRIESLIDRDYLKRDDTDAKIYHYVA